MPSLTVQQACGIDKKMDDGLPQIGNATAIYVASNPPGAVWVGVPPNPAAAGSPNTCYDNGNGAAALIQYSLGTNGGVGPNCALSFRFQ